MSTKPHTLSDDHERAVSRLYVHMKAAVDPNLRSIFRIKTVQW